MWHVNDLKVWHVEKDLVEDILKKLNEKFGKESPFEARRGKVLEYLGITLDYRERGKVKFAMCEYIIKLLEEIPP